MLYPHTHMFTPRKPEVNELGPQLLASVYHCEDNNELGMQFFSPTNIAKVQAGLRETILSNTSYLIGRQSDEGIGIVMRSVYVDHARHGAPSLPQELQRLNAIVLSILVPMVATNIAQYVGYLRDASQLPQVLKRPENMSVKGTNTMQLFRGL